MLRFLLVLAVVAVATYLLVRAFQQRGLVPGRDELQQRVQRRRPSQPSRPVAPDDDEDFLRDLDRKRLFPEDRERPEE
ncbi:MAG: hypothetical protein CMH83_00970 [Nocardioides sp.]|nr:hypothetical protein [Nocardioides sp.]